MRCSAPLFLVRLSSSSSCSAWSLSTTKGVWLSNRFVPQNRIAPCLLRRSASSSSTDNDGTTPSPSSPPPLPRAAVSTVVRCTTSDDAVTYLLVQRGKPPNKGMWSLPGGKVEYGEKTIDAAVRELREETVWPATDWENLRFHDAPFCTSDSIAGEFHYLIAQCFASVHVDALAPPTIGAADDAADAAWFTKEEIQQKFDKRESTLGVLRVIERSEDLSSAGLLATTVLPE